METNKDFLNIGLPKWPGLLVVGSPVTRDQAAEIILRTDDLYFSSNDSKFEKQLNQVLYGVTSDSMDLNKEVARKLGLEESDRNLWRISEEYMKEKDEEVGKISLSYMKNQQIISSWIGGPHGWCSWNGDIGCRNYNIGKYPSVEEVHSDWVKIAKEFPFLDLKCQLLNHEIGCEDSVEDPKPVIEFIVKKGKVKVMIPTKYLTTGEFGSDDMMRRFTNPFTERGCTIDKFSETVEKLRLKFKKETV